jgi:hypothetical protein
MKLGSIISFAVFALFIYLIFQSISGLLSPPLAKAQEAMVQGEVVSQILIINSVSPHSSLEDAEQQEEVRRYAPSERKKGILKMEEQLELYSSLFAQAEMLNIDEYDGRSVG